MKNVKYLINYAYVDCILKENPTLTKVRFVIKTSFTCFCLVFLNEMIHGLYFTSTEPCCSRFLLFMGLRVS